VLLITGRCSPPLVNVIVGVDRWINRVIAYAALMTDQSPPCRLDPGGSEPVVPPPFPAGGPGGPPRLPNWQEAPRGSAGPRDAVRLGPIARIAAEQGRR
jgi:hypothetical protein